jgi:hypothetical protein
MAQVFLSDSSRRDMQIPEEEFDQRWNEAFGERKKMTCPKCEEPAFRLRKGLCDNCRTQSNAA